MLLKVLRVQKFKVPLSGYWLLAIGFFLLSIASFAQTYPKPSGYVNDYADAWGDATHDQITEIAQNLEAKTSAELSVVSVKSVAPMPLKDYAVELFKRWGIGKKGKDNGVLFIVATEDRRVEIEVGYGLESVLPDGKCGEILDTYVVPYFKEGNWGKGMLEGAKAITATVSGEASTMPQAPKVSYSTSPSSANVPTWAIVLGVLGIIGIVGVVSHFSKPPCPKCGRRKYVKRKSVHVITHATYSHSGQQESTYYCKACDYEWTRRETIPQKVESSSSSGSSWSSGGGGSSFGGFGGGSSGGGGAGRSF